LVEKLVGLMRLSPELYGNIIKMVKLQENLVLDAARNQAFKLNEQ